MAKKQLRPQPIKYVNYTATRNATSKLAQIRQRKEEEKYNIQEEKNYAEYKERYDKAVLPSLNNIENVITYLISRNDIQIEKDYGSYSIRLELNPNNKNTYAYINLRIYHENVDIQIEEANGYNNVNIQNDFLFKKYEDALEKRYFEYLTIRANKTVQAIYDITNLNRKNKISKLIEE